SYLSNLGSKCFSLQPQLLAVGFYNDQIATFSTPTGGSVQSSILLASSPSTWSGAISEAPMPCGVPCNAGSSGTSSGEIGIGLAWATPSFGANANTILSDSVGTNDEGVAFTPSTQMIASSTTITTTTNEDIVTDQSSTTGVSTTITQTSAPTGTQ